MTLTYQRENWAQFRRDGRKLWLEHHKEVSTFKCEPDLDETLYHALEDQGKLYILTVRDNSKLAGYLMFLLMRHPHYPLLIAWEDAHFLSKPYRKTLRNPWFKLVSMAKDLARVNGAVKFTMHSKPRRALVGQILARLGAEPDDTLWSWRL